VAADAYRNFEATRPRLWVRGLLLVRTPRRWEPKGLPSRIELGGLWDDHEDINAWKHLESFVAQGDLPEDERRFSSLAGWPRLARLCADAPIRIARGAEIALLRDRDVRLLTIGNGNGELTVFVERRGVLLRSVTGAFAERAERVLRAATDGLVDGSALALARLVHVVLGGEFSDERALRRLRDDLERELDEIDTRGATMRAEAEEIARRLREHGGDETCTIPIYGVARRLRHAPLTVRSVGEGELASANDNSETLLVVPAYDEWLVDGVAPWEPPTRAVRLAREREAVVARMWRQRVVTIVIVAILGAFAVLMIMILARADAR